MTAKGSFFKSLTPFSLRIRLKALSPARPSLTTIATAGSTSISASTPTIRAQEQYRYPSPYHDAENGPPNFLLRNNRDGSFRDVTSDCGLNKNNTRYSFCCGWNDYNNDGWADLYVVNDFGRKNLYRNNGDGTFTDVAAELGVEDVGAGMSVSWLDYDRDGAPDLYVGNMWTATGLRISRQDNFKQASSPQIRAQYQKHAMGNSLFRNGKEKFEDKTQAAGVGMGRWAWSSDAFDFDHDGYPDLYVTNGMVSGSSPYDLNSFFWRQVVAQSPDQAEASHDYEQAWNAINELIRADGTWSGYERNVFYANIATARSRKFLPSLVWILLRMDEHSLWPISIMMAASKWR